MVLKFEKFIKEGLKKNSIFDEENVIPVKGYGNFYFRITGDSIEVYDYPNENYVAYCDYIEKNGRVYIDEDDVEFELSDDCPEDCEWIGDEYGVELAVQINETIKNLPQSLYYKIVKPYVIQL